MRAATLAKVTRRIIPFTFVCYVVAYIDRVNIGFAAKELQRDLSLSDTAYGIGAGLFFLGYCLFEIPSNLILERVGARLWMARIMVGLGTGVDGHHVRERRHVVLRRACAPRYRRSGLLSRRRALSHLLDSSLRAGADQRALHDWPRRSR